MTTKELSSTDGASRHSGAVEPLLSPREVARITGRSLSALAKDRMQRRGIAFVKLLGRVRYAPADVEAFLAAHRVETDDGARRG